MLERTRRLWETQRSAVGDRRRLFRAVADHAAIRQVLYPGSYVDLTPSVCWESVTYVDTDRRAARFFADVDGVVELVREEGATCPAPVFRFLHADYTSRLDLDPASFDLLVSLYAGPVSLHCGDAIRPGGLLLANASHGDVALASIDPRFRLVGVVQGQAGQFRLHTDDLDSYLEPKRDVELTVDGILRSGRGVAYTRSAFAYLFERAG